MRTPEQWIELAGHNDLALMRKAVELDARFHLAALEDWEELTSADIAEKLFPEELAKASDAGFETKRMIFVALMHLARNGMEDCCKKDQSKGKKYMGKIARPWVWLKCAPLNVCSHCGQIVPEGLTQ